MPKRYFEDLSVGETVEPPMARTISETDLYVQAGLTGSYNPIHTDKEYMKETEFGRPLVQNALLLTVMEGLTRRLPWQLEIIAAYGRDGIRYTSPVFVDDTVRLETEVVEKRPKDDERGVVTLKQDLFKQDGTLAVTGEYLLLLRRAPSEPSERSNDGDRISRS